MHDKEEHQMAVLYFDNDWWPYHHSEYYHLKWPAYDRWRFNESAWLVPGTDPDDPLYAYGG